MTDHEAATLFARALAATLDSYGHLAWCFGTGDDTTCDDDDCRQARQAVQTARELGYLPALVAESSH